MKNSESPEENARSIALGFALMARALNGDMECLQQFWANPAEAWPEKTQRIVAQAMKDLRFKGRPLTIKYIEEATGLTGIIPPTLHPSTLG